MKNCSLYLVSLLLILTTLSSCSSQQTIDRQGEDSPLQEIGLSEQDPWEGFNRKMFSFNEWLDKYFLRPVAVGYDAVLPNFVQKGIGNFFSNLGEVYSIVNNVLQLDGEGAGTSFMRLTVNTTFGFFGLFDIATEVGMRKDKEDFGQTLGHWGVGAGNYLVLPIFGPSSTRDIFQYVDNIYYDEYSVITYDRRKRYGLTALKVLQLRADLLDLEKQISGDKYNFIRDIYMQHREFIVNDGEIGKDVFFDDEDDEVGDDDF